MITNQNRSDVSPLLSAAVDLRPMEELYDIRDDPACLNNLAETKKHQDLKESLSIRLIQYLTHTDDLRVTDPQAAHQWEMYPRHSSLRWFPEPQWWSDKGNRVPPQPWLEERRPR
jgi:uncharacterized sulfatase